MMVINEVYMDMDGLSGSSPSNDPLGCRFEDRVFEFHGRKVVEKICRGWAPFGIDKLVWCFDPFIAVLLPETKNWLVHADFKSNNEAALEEARKSVENRFREIHRLVLSKVD
jgi:hypothetical protein